MAGLNKRPLLGSGFFGGHRKQQAGRVEIFTGFSVATGAGIL